jgi:hypothetical protein
VQNAAVRNSPPVLYLLRHLRYDVLRILIGGAAGDESVKAELRNGGLKSPTGLWCTNGISRRRAAHAT